MKSISTNDACSQVKVNNRNVIIQLLEMEMRWQTEGEVQRMVVNCESGSG